MSAFNIQIISGEYAILKLEQGRDLPNFISKAKFFSLLKSNTELSLICDEKSIPADFIGQKIDRDWSLMKLVGPFDFDQTGVLSNFLRPLAHAEIGILAISSFDTDYVLVKTKNLSRAKIALENEKYLFIAPDIT